MRRKFIHFLLIFSIPLIISASVGGREKEGNTVSNTDAASVEASEGTTNGDANIPAKQEKKQDAVPRQADESKDTGDLTKTEKHPPNAGDIKKENRKKQPIRRETAAPEKEVIQERRDDLLLIDHESIRDGRIPGIKAEKEDVPDSTIVKIPEDKIFGKPKDKKPKGGLFGLSMDTVAKVGLLIFIIIVLIIYKMRTKKSKRKVVRIIPKR